MGWPNKGYGDWAQAVVKIQYVCRTPSGLTRITSEDLWAAIEEYEEYEERV